MRLAVVSHNYLDDRYVGKLRALAQHAEVLLVQAQALPFAPPAGQLAGPFQVRTLPAVFLARARTSTRWTLAGLGRALRDFRPDAILVENEVHSFVALQVLWDARALPGRTPVFAAFYQNTEPDGPFAFVVEALSRLAIPRFAGLMPSSADGAAILRAKGAQPARVAIIPAVGFDETTFPQLPTRGEIREDLGIPGNAFVVGFSGRFVPEKGIDEILQAAAMCGESAVWLAVGGGPMGSALRESPRVVVREGLPPREAMRLYAAMDCLVLPSRTTRHWKEQFGRVIPEAHYAGIPVIGSRSGAIPEVVGPGGWIVPERDSRALADAVEAARRDPAARSERASSGRERAIALYSASAIARRTVEFIGSLC